MSRAHQTDNVEQINFNYLVYDIAWFGIALAATSRFMSLFAIRLGANAIELSLISSLPGIMLLVSTGFTTWWRRRYQGTTQSLILPSLGFRLVFLLPAFAPMFPKELQPLWLILAVTLPALPQGISGAIFLVMLRESVSQNRVPSLLSKRSLALNITVGIGAIAFGVMLEVLPFPINYQVMFVIAFAFALMSQWYVMNIRILFPEPPRSEVGSAWSVWKSRGFLSVAFVTFATHVAFFSIITVTPLRLVEELGAGEGFMAMFGLAELAAGATVTMFTTRIIERLGTQITIAMGMLSTAAAALIIATAPNQEWTLIAAFLSGGGWTTATLGVLSFLFERTPAEGSTHTSAAFQQMVALGIFVGPLIGGTLVDWNVSIVEVMMLGIFLRLLAGILTYYNPMDMVDGHQRMLHPLYALHRRGRRR